MTLLNKLLPVLAWVEDACVFGVIRSKRLLPWLLFCAAELVEGFAPKRFEVEEGWLGGENKDGPEEGAEDWLLLFRLLNRDGFCVLFC